MTGKGSSVPRKSTHRYSRGKAGSSVRQLEATGLCFPRCILKTLYYVTEFGNDFLANLRGFPQGNEGPLRANRARRFTIITSAVQVVSTFLAYKGRNGPREVCQHPYRNRGSRVAFEFHYLTSPFQRPGMLHLSTRPPEGADMLLLGKVLLCLCPRATQLLSSLQKVTPPPPGHFMCEGMGIYLTSECWALAYQQWPHGACLQAFHPRAAGLAQQFTG